MSYSCVCAHFQRNGLFKWGRSCTGEEVHGEWTRQLLSIVIEMKACLVFLIKQIHMNPSCD